MATGYTKFTVSSSLPVTFSYICQFCGKPVTQKAELSVNTSAEVRSRDANRVSQQGLMNSASDRLWRLKEDMDTRLEALRAAGEVQDLKAKRRAIGKNRLTVYMKMPNKCPCCGKKQAWASTFGKGWAVLTGLAWTIAGAALGVLLSGGANSAQEEKSLLTYGIIFLVIGAVLLVWRLLTDRRAKNTMTKECVPTL